MSDRLQSLDCLIEQHVTSHYSDLLSRAVASSQLEQSLAVMSTHINSLLMSSERLTTRLRDPYEKIKAGTKTQRTIRCRIVTKSLISRMEAVVPEA